MTKAQSTTKGAHFVCRENSRHLLRGQIKKNNTQTFQGQLLDHRGNWQYHIETSVFWATEVFLVPIRTSCVKSWPILRFLEFHPSPCSTIHNPDQGYNVETLACALGTFLGAFLSESEKSLLIGLSIYRYNTYMHNTYKVESDDIQKKEIKSRSARPSGIWG